MRHAARLTAPLALVVSVLAPSPVSAQDVQVTLTHGGRYVGRLVSLDSTEVIIRQPKSGRDTRTALADIRIVETVHHNTRNLGIIGAAVGVAFGLSADWCGTGRSYASSGPSGEPDCITPAPMLMTAVGAAFGAMIGHAMDRDRRRVLYPATPRTVAIIPTMSRSAVGGRLLVRW